MWWTVERSVSAKMPYDLNSSVPKVRWDCRDKGLTQRPCLFWLSELLLSHLARIQAPYEVHTPACSFPGLTLQVPGTDIVYVTQNFTTSTKQFHQRIPLEHCTLYWELRKMWPRMTELCDQLKRTISIQNKNVRRLNTGPMKRRNG